MKEKQPMRVLSFIKPDIYCLAVSIGVAAFPIYASAHSGGLNAQGCHAGSQPYHCHRPQTSQRSNLYDDTNVITGTVTRIRDGDTIELDGFTIRLAGLDCPENGTQEGNFATIIANIFQGRIITCELTGAKSYDRLVGYCSVNGTDFGKYMIQNSSCTAWEIYDVWDRY